MTILGEQGIVTTLGSLWKEVGGVGVLTLAFFWKVWPWLQSYMDRKLAFDQARQVAQETGQKSMAEAVNNNTIALRELQQLVHDRLLPDRDK